jgi:Spy/CpxP family protein refolding chaperone
MKLFRTLALAALVALTASLATAADDPKDQPKKDQPKGRTQGKAGQLQPDRIFGQFGQQGPLLTPEAVDKLKLTDDQKKQYDKIASEYKDKQKEASDKIRDLIQGGNAQGIVEAFQNMREDSQKLRNDYLTKVGALLTDEQKKTFDEVKKEQPGRPGGGRGPGNGGGLTLPGRNTTTPPPVGDVLSKPALEKLKLNDEQKKKVEELQKELETKLNDLLTDEQKKQLEELKKDASRTPETPRRPGRGNDR